MPGLVWCRNFCLVQVCSYLCLVFNVVLVSFYRLFCFSFTSCCVMDIVDGWRDLIVYRWYVINIIFWIRLEFILISYLYFPWNISQIYMYIILLLYVYYKVTMIRPSLWIDALWQFNITNCMLIWWNPLSTFRQR